MPFISFTWIDASLRSTFGTTLLLIAIESTIVRNNSTAAGDSLVIHDLPFNNKRNYEILSTLRFPRSFIQFVMIVFPSMTPSMFYSIPKPCCSFQTTPFPFSHHQQPPILISSQSLLHSLSPHKSLRSTCFHLHVQMRFISINHHETPIPCVSPLYSHLSHPTLGIYPNWLQMS